MIEAGCAVGAAGSGTNVGSGTGSGLMIGTGCTGRTIAPCCGVPQYGQNVTTRGNAWPQAGLMHWYVICSGTVKLS